MSVQRVVLSTGEVRYKARIKSRGRQVATRRFTRRGDAVAWEQDQLTRLRHGDWIDPRRGRVSMFVVAEAWLLTRDGVKRRTRETDALTWARYIQPTFGTRTVASITAAEVSEWAAQLVASGLSAGTARRALATFRGILGHAVADDRLIRNVAAAAKQPRGGAVREGQALTFAEVEALTAACRGRYADLVMVLAFTGLRWGELAGLQIGDRVAVPGPGLRVQRAVLAGGGAGDLFVDTLKTNRARTVPLPGTTAEIIERWSGDRDFSQWIFPSTTGTALSENNWKRMIAWTEAKRAIGRPTLRVHDLRHTAASIWLGAGADAKVVQRVLGHATASLTLDLYGHLMDNNLWENARRLGDRMGTAPAIEKENGNA